MRKRDCTRYSITGNIEGEFEPGSTVLKNKLGIRSRRRMDAREFEALRRTQARCFRSATADTTITNALILEMHRHFLGGIYPWAGRYRTVNLSKPGFVWPPAGRIPQNMAAFERDALKTRTPCRPGPLERVAESIAVVHAEFLLIHAFREGNGRLARLIAGIMALQAGCPPPEFGFRLRKNRSRYLRAVKRGYLRDYGELTEVVIDAIRRAKKAAGRLSGRKRA
ncbi:MAG: Fic family protein [Elusimicrobiota bacterium]